MNLMDIMLKISCLLALLLLLTACASTSTVDVQKQPSEPVVHQDTAIQGTNSAVVQSGLTSGAITQNPLTNTSSQTVKDYLIGSQDLLDIKVFGVEELSGTVRVNSRGFISLPLIGIVEAKGVTDEELAERIEFKLQQDYLQDPNVTVFIREYASRRVTIEGEVEKSGIFALTSTTTLMQSIALAGGLSQLADSEDIRLFREVNDGQRQMLSFDLNKIRAGEQSDPILRNNDIIIVEKSGTRAFLRDSIFRDAIDLFNPFRILN